MACRGLRSLRFSFIAFIRRHGLYSSTDGANFTPLAAQPSAGLVPLNCPAGRHGNAACGGLQFDVAESEFVECGAGRDIGREHVRGDGGGKLCGDGVAELSDGTACGSGLRVLAIEFGQSDVIGASEGYADGDGGGADICLVCAFFSCVTGRRVTSSCFCITVWKRGCEVGSFFCEGPCFARRLQPRAAVPTRAYDL